jgi:hypothetical protein
VTISGFLGSGFVVSAGLLDSDEHALSSASSVSASAAHEYLYRVPRLKLLRSSLRCSRLAEIAVPGIAAALVAGSLWAWLDSFMGILPVITLIGFVCRATF